MKRIALVVCACATLALPFQAAADGVSVRFATFNASLNRNELGQLLEDLGGVNAASVDITRAYAVNADASAYSEQQRRILQIHNVAEIVQRIDADVLLVNEFDFDAHGIPGSTSVPMPLGYSSLAAQLFQDHYLSVGHGGSATGRLEAAPILYEYRYTPATNTGIPSGFDLNNSGDIGGGDDAYGFGTFPGQYGFTVYSKYPIVAVRTFQTFLWKDMPGSLLIADPTVDDPATTDIHENLDGFFSAEEIEVLRLSSKNHVDVVLDIHGQRVHFLVAHPTPPTFDGPEDRNGKRNHDEIRFWADYVAGGEQAAYIYDDQGGQGGLEPGALFVIAGDYNADPVDGDSYADAIRQLLDNPQINAGHAPESVGGTLAATDPDNNGPANASHVGDPKFDTADFNDIAPGNLRVDYVLPSSHIEIVGSWVFWPAEGDPDRALVGEFGAPDLFSGFPTSDHRAVFVDTVIPAGENASAAPSSPPQP